MNWMNDLAALWQTHGGWAIGGLLALVGAGFVLHFVLPALWLGRDLQRAIRALGAIAAGAAKDTPADPQQIGREVMATPRLAHLWREYVQTLHGLTPAKGAPQVAVWRATTMAEQFFTEQALVDTPLKTEFYKHLPGILTGIGIIGTFSGLIAGLAQFEVSSNPETVRAGLHGLIRGVGHAFEISAAAIALAMLFTWIEKSLVTARYRQVERLVQLIDGLFDTGVGEEYLARLVRAAEVSAQQGAQLREAIVGELRQSMEGLFARQQEISQQQQQAQAALLGKAVAEAVAKTVGAALGEPLARMAAAVEKLGASQNANLAGALEKALQGFNARLDGSFGARQNDLENLLAKTAGGMDAAVEALGRVAGGLERSGRVVVDAAAGRLESAGSGINQAGAAFARTSQDMAQAATAMTAAAQMVGQSMDEQRRAREAIAQMVADLAATVDNARREASLTGELVGRLENAAGAFGRAGQQAESYLHGVSDVLGQAHAAFADNIEATLASGNGQFQKSVVDAVEALQGAVEELTDALARAPAGRAAAR